MLSPDIAGLRSPHELAGCEKTRCVCFDWLSTIEKRRSLQKLLRSS